MVSNSTRGLFVGGYNSMDHQIPLIDITIASTGDAKILVI